MRYISTRGKDNPQGFEDVLLAGLARDGGLYLPEEYPHLSKDEWASLRGKPYTEIATEIMYRFIGEAMTREEVFDLVCDSYKDFTHAEIAPLIELSDDLYLVELFHGPTIAFKDYAMQFLARAFDKVLAKRGARAVILGATSGDTGSSALEAFKGREHVDIFILFPEGRVTPIQQKQMTSVLMEGAFAIAVDGDFDACQSAVKVLFGDLDFRDRLSLSAINSINWVRLMPQIVYYASAALSLGAPEREVAFSVPTGNFGNIFAGYVARRMGLPIAKLICASNRNDILTRFFESGRMERQETIASLSPSMDIQVSSNFERLLFELLNRDGEATATQMQDFASKGVFSVSPETLAEAHKIFTAARFDDQATLKEIKRAHEEYDLIIDPHSAIGLAAAQDARSKGECDMPIISLACAHPSKFPDAVKKAIDITPALPPHLKDLMERKERMLSVANDPKAIASLIEKNIRHCQ